MSRVGEKYCLSIKTLYEEIGEDLEFATIEYCKEEEEDNEYFDLYGTNRNLIACMDGEEVTVIKDQGDTLVFINENGLQSIEFTLTLTEFKIAAFN